MGLYNFQKRFAEAVESGAKTHTIRGRRAHPDKPGNTLHLYTGLRQKGSRLLLRAICTKVEEITISEVGDIVIDGNQLSDDECFVLATRDGFEDRCDMLKFWDGRLPFEGHVIHWKAGKL
jgi:hypothetical protein